MSENILAKVSREFFTKHRVHRYRMKKVSEMDDITVIRCCHWFCEEQGLVEEFLTLLEEEEEKLKLSGGSH